MAGYERGADQYGFSDLCAREARHERVRTRGRDRLSHLLGIRARARWPVGRLSVARPRSEREERDQLLVASPRPLLSCKRKGRLAHRQPPFFFRLIAA